MHTIRPIRKEDLDEWQRMRCVLWPDSDSDHAQECRLFFAGECRDVQAVRVAERDGAGLCGFIELNLRNYAEGSVAPHVAYVEGWYVDPDQRRAGLGTALMRAAEDWARSQGLTELASDAEIDNRTRRTAQSASKKWTGSCVF